MSDPDQRAHGVTPGLSRDYADRNALHQATFVLPYLQTGMRLLDLGCGPGTITLGLAETVAPGRVTGVDHDPQHIIAAQKLASEHAQTNLTFQPGDALTLGFDAHTFDAAFENNLFVHLARHATQAAREVFRVLKPGGFFAARDAAADSVVWGHPIEEIQQFDKFFYAWQANRGSDVTLGRRLPEILREAGFRETRKSVSADTKGTPQETRSHAAIMVYLLDGPLGRFIREHQWADPARIAHLKAAIQAWGEHPDAFFANVHVEVIGRKPS